MVDGYIRIPLRSRGIGLRSLVLIGSTLCLAATSVVAWDSFRPWSNPMDAAIAEADRTPANTEVAKGAATRLLQILRPGIESITAMCARGDDTASHARTVLLHWLGQSADQSVTVEQIRTRLRHMPEADFVDWIRKELK